MLNSNKMNIVDILLMATIILFLVEVIFLDTALLFLIALCGAGLFFGKRSYYRPRGKFMFWISIVALFIMLINTIAFRFLIMTAVIYFCYKWYRSKQEPTFYQPQFSENSSDEGVIHQDILFSNKWFGQQRTRKRAYEWRDVNIQSGIGDIVVDLNYTVIPKDDPVMVIRNLVGNVQILVPYDVEVSVHHSVVFGSIQILNYLEANVWNKVLHMETPNYSTSKQKVRIFTSMLVGKVEVKRG
ncbi:cell wall-active antibiotics response protein LiaF [Aquibacillus kalidii]|uniref:cell wall-active antibiotics response protein LiaF n=1 Tax=Aquibacillus kalidii TaxID=2762597 RepID=UPI001646CAE7|nr:cell wall-active antibiotics response protein LiaF [Aquibacillus kalidii]